MKLVKKIIGILSINILILLFLLFICDFIIYKIYSEPKKYFSKYPQASSIPPFKYSFKNIKVFWTGEDIIQFFTNNTNDSEWGCRLPEGLQYCNNTSCNPIIVFGDSYTYGEFLKYNQTFSYKLAYTLKRPVYNRAIPGVGIEHMYYQVSDEEVNELFFNQVKPADTVFYTLIDDHYIRMSIFGSLDILYDTFSLRYRYINNKPVKDNYNNIFLNIIKSSPTITILSLKYAERYVNNPKNADKLTDLALAFFKETRNILEKKWNKKIKFIVIFYDNNEIRYKEMLRQKLEDNNFIVIDTDELTDEDLNSEKYLFQDNLHPKETAWDLLVPLIIKKANL